ncbi:TRAP transporter permease [Robertmurraya yapensis]|uniref:TRAP transporter permease n=2 Tax=Bacillaceae TaxID=186817 RepID=A0A431W3J2_9BACI|nr:TRAP transporter permease [Bacillus yapensis]RTR29952.1 TRAP transporter permease [Bacillus yapensis]TKS95033.1 TRAP transporter fused permease subunit [Bacillus yapensis]
MVKKLVFFIALATSLFTVYTATFGQFTPVLQRGIFIGLILLLVFLLYPTSKNKKWLRVIDIIALLGVISSITYLYISYPTIESRIGYVNHADTIFGLILVVLLLEACRRVTGWALTIIAGIFLAYGFFGFLVPGYFGHEGYDLARLMTTMFLTTEGVFGSALAAAATFVAMFIIFGTFLEKGGAGQVFIDLAMAVGGRKRGGPAKVAVFASALMGSVNGSPVANVTTTGVFTIPLMKKVGYKNEVAGAVEAVASTGGSILPPVMGAGAFIMAEMAGLPYSAIVTAAVIPALLYYLSIYMVVDFEAAKNKLEGLSKEDTPDLKETLKKGILLLLPLFVLIFFLVFAKVSVTRAALYSILAVIIVSFFTKDKKMGIRLLIETFIASAKSMIVVSVACATAGIVVGIITLSGLGLKLSGVLLSIGESSLFLTLVLTMIGAVIIGMGLPPTPAYIVFSVLATPALVQLGVPLLAAHMFVFYYSCFAPITPPVALAAFTAAGISDAKPFKTGWTSFIYALPAFIIPFLFIYGPELMGEGTWPQIIYSTLTASIGVIAIGAATTGWFRKNLVIVERILMLVAGVTLVIPGLLSDIIGVILIVVANLLIQIRKSKASNLNSNNSVKEAVE